MKRLCLSSLLLALPFFVLLSPADGMTVETASLTWQATSPLPEPLTSLAAAKNEQYVFAAGGAGSDSVYFASINGDETLGPWVSTTSLPRVRSAHSAEVDSGYLFVVGGYYCCWSGTKSVVSAPISSSGAIGSWSELTPLPNDLYRHATVVYDNNLYVIGGWRDFPAPGSAESKVYKAAIHPDGTLGDWENLAPLPKTLHAHSAVVSNGYIFVIGGKEWLGDTTQDSVYSGRILSDGTIEGWNTVDPLPIPLHYHSATLWDGRIIVTGGRTDNDVPVSTTYIANVEPNGNIGAWEESTALPNPLFRHDSVSSVDSVYVIGGQDGSSDQSSVYLGRDSIEINQVLGRQYAGAQKYVAGKDTVVRVHLPEPDEPDPATQRVDVWRDGSYVTTLYPSSEHPVLTFHCPTREACGNWQAGTYTFVVVVNDFSSQTTAVFQPVRPLRIRAVKVKLSDQGETVELSGDDWKTAGAFLSKVYPLDSDSLEWIYDNSVLDATGLDLRTDDGRQKLADKLHRRQPWQCWLLGISSACYDQVIGFIPPMPTSCSAECDFPCGCSEGWSQNPKDPLLPLWYGFPRVSIVLGPGSFETTCPDQHQQTVVEMVGTVAHEVGHSFGLGDEYNHPYAEFHCDVNAPPEGYVGRLPGDELSCDPVAQCAESEGVEEWGPGMGTKVSRDEDHPYDSQQRVALGDKLSFMGSGAPDSSDYWVSPAVYDQLFDQLVTQDPIRVSDADSQRVAVASGWIERDDGIELEAWYEITTTIASSVTGAYKIEAVDATSQTLASSGFDVSFVVLSNPPMSVDRAPFHAVVPFPVGTQAFWIMRGDSVLAVRQVSANKPTASLTAPTLGEFVAGQYTITWQSSDADSEQLYHTVEYSHDGDDWLVLAAAITETQFTADFAALPGGDQARLRLIVSDGVNTTEAIGEAFQVGSKAPEVFIESPADGARYAPGANATLYGSAYDLQDGWLRSASELEWSSNLDGVLGNGELLNLSDLSVGEHTITLAATNSLDMTSTGQVRVSIGGRQIYLPLILRTG